MKTIKEKANEAWENYEYRETPHLYKSVFEDGYVLGAEEALASQWRSVKDEMPKDDADVLIRCEDGIQIGYYRKEYDSWLDYGFTESKVTHWMPIPENPKILQQ